VAALRAAGAQVREVWVPAGSPRESRADALRSRGAALRAVADSVLAVARAVKPFLQAAREPADAVLVPYGGTLDAALARWAARGPRRPLLVVDAFLSLWESAVVDRAAVRSFSARAIALSLLDRLAVRAGDLFLVDTPQTARYFADRYGVNLDRCLPVPVGSDLPASPVPPIEGELRTLFVGTGIPFHGLPVLLEAFRQLSAEAVPVTLDLVGGTPEDREAAASLRAVSVHLAPIDRSELAALHGRAHCVFGVFGKGEKADRVVPCKVYDGLAAGRPVITGESAAVRSLLHGAGGVRLVPRGDPDAIARAVVELLRDPSVVHLGRANRHFFEARFSAESIGREILEGITRTQPRRALGASRVRTAPS
jgi:glycosyltransferase involved in cell wall biosynthesis